MKERRLCKGANWATVHQGVNVLMVLECCVLCIGGLHSACAAVKYVVYSQVKLGLPIIGPGVGMCSAMCCGWPDVLVGCESACLQLFCGGLVC